MAQASNSSIPYMGRHGGPQQMGHQNPYMYPQVPRTSYPGYNAPPPTGDQNQYYSYLPQQQQPPQNDLSQVYPTPSGASQAYRGPNWDQRQQYPAGGRRDMVSQYRPETPPPAQEPYPFSQIYSFVPIHGAQHQKRPRRKYEEVERIYKCGWNGCEKAYGTLNHLNAHVTMQNHGQKRSPEEFKEIRKEWKAKKKAEETAKKDKEAKQQAEAAASQAKNEEDRRDSGVSATDDLSGISGAHATDHYPLPEPSRNA